MIVFSRREGRFWREVYESGKVCRKFFFVFRGFSLGYKFIFELYF